MTQTDCPLFKLGAAFNLIFSKVHISWPNKREEMETDRRVCSSPISRHDSHLHTTLRLTASHFKQPNLYISTTLSRNSRLERLRSSQPYTYVTLSASFYNNGLREVGRDGRCSSGNRQHDDIWSASLVHDHKIVVLHMFVVLLPQSVRRHTQSSTMVIWITQVNWAIFVTEINGKKWPTLPYVHVNVRFMIWSHTWRPSTGKMLSESLSVYWERNITLPPASMQHSFPYWPAWGWNHPKQQTETFPLFPTRFIPPEYIFSAV